jgi:hypothetical protein
MKEQWRHIADFEAYEVSDAGRVRHGSKILVPSPASDGYVRVSLRGNSGIYKQRNIHILVAKAFIPNPQGLPTVNHKDTIKTNCWATNLEWRSRAGQMHHARLTTFKSAGMDFFKDGRKKPWRARYALNGKNIHIGVFATRRAAQAARAQAIARLLYVV